METVAPGIDFEEHLRRSNGRSSRHSIVSVRLTRSEQAELERMAKAERKSLSEWCRDALLGVARGESVTATFTEVVAIRQLLNFALETIACRDDVTHAKFQDEVQTIRSTKHKAAAEVMQQYAAPEKSR